MKNNNQNNRNRRSNSGYENDYGRQSSGDYNQYSRRNDFPEYDDDAGYPNQSDAGQRSRYGSQRSRYSEGSQNSRSEFRRSRGQDYEGGRNYNPGFGNDDRDFYGSDYYDKTHNTSGINRSSFGNRRNEDNSDYFTDDLPANRGVYNSDYGRENRGYEERNPRSYQSYLDQDSYSNYGSGNHDSGGYGNTGSGNRNTGRNDWGDSSRYGRYGQHRGKGPRGYQRSDERIHDDINDRLSDEGNLDATDIEVKVQNGEVTLTGTVGDKQSKRLAEDIAEEVSGVNNVENRIKVSKEETESQSSTGTSASSAENKKSNSNSSSEKKEKAHHLN